MAEARRIALFVALVAGGLALLIAAFVWGPWWLRDAIIAVGCVSALRDLRRWQVRRRAVSPR